MQTFRDFSGGKQWERVTFADSDGKVKTLILRLTSETERMLMGIVVDRDDDEIAPKGVDEVKRLIDKSLITKRVPMVMNNMYAMLEPKK